MKVTKNLFWKILIKFKGKKTIFFSTHKMDILKYFDRVIFINEGIIEKDINREKSN